MVVALIVIWVLLALIIVYSIGRNAKAVEELSVRSDGIVKAFKGMTAEIKKTETELQITKDEADACSGEIDEIIRHLNLIVADIHRLDERITKVSEDEKEIRSYYVNFREPVINAGVPWADEMRCKDDEESL